MEAAGGEEKKKKNEKRKKINKIHPGDDAFNISFSFQL